MSNKSNQKGGSVALLILVMAAFLGILYIGQIEVAKSSIEVNKQKQLLDMAGTLLGNNIIKSGISYNCANGEFQNDSRIILETAAREMNIHTIPNIKCHDLGTYIDELGQTKHRLQITSTTGVSSKYANGELVNREIIIEFKEQTQEIKKPDSSITFILDYSGSMNSFNRRQQLVNAFNQFIAGQYDIKYGASLFSTDVIQPSVNINKGGIHDQLASQRISNQRADGSTNFTAGLNDAKNLLRNQPIDKHFFVFITDGDPTAGGEPVSWVRQNIFNIPPNNCRRLNPDVNCITIYSLGVNISDTNADRLIKMSGNAATPENERVEYFFYATNQQIGLAFDNIIANILCKWGPIAPIPSNLNELQNLNIFLNDQPINKNDWELDENTYEIKLYNQVCDQILENGGLITSRYGKINLKI